MTRSTLEKAKKAVTAKFVGQDKGVVEYKYDNGLKLLLVENHTAPVVTILVLYKVGSRNEGVGFTGATHFLEHMLFKGTKAHNADKGNGIDDLLTQIGAYWNATTWFDRTSYFEVVPIEYMELCVKLEADRMRNLLLRQSDRNSEMSVVRNELERGENYPEEVLEKELYAIAFREHPYHHPTIGWRSDVEGVPLDRLKKFYDTFYWPNNATVVLLGDFEKDNALSMVDKYFGKIPSSPEPIPTVYTTEPPQEGERRFEVSRAGDLPRVWLGFKVCEAVHEDNYAIAAIRQILGSTYERSSRLYKALVDNGIACDVFARHDELRDPGLFLVGATLNPGATMLKAEKILNAEMQRFCSEPVTEEELARAKSANRKGTILAKADSSSLAFMLGEAESKADWQWLMNYDEKFEELTAEKIQEVAAKYFLNKNKTVGHFKPLNFDEAMLSELGEEDDEELETPDEQMEPSNPLPLKEPEVVAAEAPDLNGSLTRDEVKKFLEPNPKTVAVKLKKSPVTASFEERVKKVVLPNGLTLQFLPSFGTGCVGMAVNVKAGKYFTHDRPSSQSELVGDLLSRGSSKYSKADIAEALENMGIPGGLEFSVDNYRMGIGTHVVKEDFALYLDILSDVMRNPTLDEEELKKIQIEWRARLIESANNTRSVAWYGMKNALYAKDHPFSEPGFKQQIEELMKIKRADLVDVHRRLLSPQSTIITVVGDTSFDEVEREILAKFGSWQGEKEPEVVIPETVLPDKRSYFQSFLPDKSSADIVLAHPCTLMRKNPDFYSARLANAALGQDTITSRLGNVVRDKAGLTYGVNSSFSDTTYGGTPWSVQLTVNPSNVAKSLRLVDEVLAEFMGRGVSEEELAREAGRAVGSFKVGLSSPSGIARVLTELEFIGLGAKELDMVSTRYLSVTKSDVDKSLKKYLHPDKLTCVIAGTLK